MNLINCKDEYLPHWNPNVEIFEYLDKNGLQHSSKLVNKICDEFVGMKINYHYNMNEYKCVVNTFNEVLLALISDPELFRIPLEYIKDYSDQQLDYMHEITEKMLNIIYDDM